MAENKLPELDDIDTEEKLGAFCELVYGKRNESALRAKAILSYLENSGAFKPLEFRNIRNIMLLTVAETTRGWRATIKHGNDLFEQDMIREALGDWSSSSDWLERMFVELVDKVDSFTRMLIAENKLFDLDDIDTEEKLIAFSELVNGAQTGDLPRARAIMSYLRNTGDLGSLDFDSIRSVIMRSVAVTTPAWCASVKNADRMTQDLIMREDDMHGYFYNGFEKMLVELVADMDCTTADLVDDSQ